MELVRNVSARLRDRAQALSAEIEYLEGLREGTLDAAEELEDAMADAFAAQFSDLSDDWSVSEGSGSVFEASLLDGHGDAGCILGWFETFEEAREVAETEAHLSGNLTVVRKLVEGGIEFTRIFGGAF